MTTKHCTDIVQIKTESTMKVLLMADNPVIEFLGPVLILSSSFTFLSTRQTKFILCEAYEVGFDFVFPPEQSQ